MGKSSNKRNQSARGTENSDRDVVGDGEAGQHSADNDLSSPMSDNAALPDTGLDSQPHTCCPVCHTVFEVVTDLLASSDTRVRCGECLSIFDALINLRRDDFLDDDDDFLVDEYGNIIESITPYASAMSGANDDFAAGGDYTAASQSAEQLSASLSEEGNDTSNLDVTYSDFDLFSGEVELPEVAYFDQTQETEHIRFDDPSGDETFSDTLFAHDLTVEPVDLSSPGVLPHTPGLDREVLADDVAFVTDDVHREPLVFRYREQGKTPVDSIESHPELAKGIPEHYDDDVVPDALSGNRKMAHGGWLMRSLLGVVLLVIVGGLYTYRNPDAIVKNPDLRPWLARLCAVAGCKLPPMIDLDAIQFLKRTVFTHPTLENSLVIDLAFINQAVFEQPYPVLQFSWKDRNGRLIVQNNVAPAEYLGKWGEGDMMSAGERLDLSLTVEDPGEKVTDFIIEFR